MALWSNAKLLTTLCQRGVLTFSLYLRIVRGGHCACKIPGFQRLIRDIIVPRGRLLGSSSSTIMRWLCRRVLSRIVSWGILT